MPRKTYADYNRPGEAETFEQQHFSGSFGTFLRESDEAVLESYLQDQTASILDVGAGSGRLSLHLAARRPAFVVAADASIKMLQTARSRRPTGKRPEFVLADAQDLPFDDKSFDYVLSFRTIMHLPNWTRAIGEMCRVAAQAVVLDAPARFAAPGIEAAFHQAMHSLGKDAAPYRTFVRRDFDRAFHASGFAIDRLDRRFVLPVKVSRMMGNSRLPERAETFFRLTGMNRLLGGQYVCRAVPR